MGVVSRKWMWVESMSVASGCDCKEVYRFPHITYPYSSFICSFLQHHPYTKKHTQTYASYPAMDINCMPSSSGM